MTWHAWYFRLILAGLALTCVVSPFFSAAQELSGKSTIPSAAVPSLVEYRGALTDAQGKPLTGMAGVTFSIYKDQTGGAPLWMETQNVNLNSSGRYGIYLGAGSPAGLPADLFAAGEARWLGVQPEGQAEQARVLLVSVPYALKAADADTLGGKPASSYVTADQLAIAAAATGTSASSVGGNGNGAAKPGSDVAPSACPTITSDGNAKANYVALFTTPCNLEDSGIYQATDGFIGLGTIAPSAPFDIESTQTETSGTVIGERVSNTLSPSTNSAAYVYGIFSQANTAAGNASNFSSLFAGMGMQANHYGTGTVANLYGGDYVAGNRSTGAVTNAAALSGVVANYSTGIITNAYGVQVATPVNLGGGSITNYYGVYIGNATETQNSWGLYSLTGQNYIGGNLGIGTTTPSVSLEVNGNMKLDGAGHGITYPDGTVQTTAALQGSGTINKVTAGTDLTGGGAGPTVTLNLDTTKVPTLAAANNTFTGGLTASSFTGNGAGLSNVNASELGGVAANAFPQLAVANQFTNAQNISTAVSGAALEVVNNYSSGNGAHGVVGITGGSLASGVYGRVNNQGGAGVTGFTDFLGSVGVYGELDAPSQEGQNKFNFYPFGYGVWADTVGGGYAAALLATTDDAPAVVAYNNTSGYPTIYAENDYPSSSGTGWALYAGNGSNGYCIVDTTGTLTCTGALVDVVTTPGKRALEMYSVQATENRFEDVGSAELVGGKAIVQLDPSFVEMVNTTMSYQVFLTPSGDCKGLYVAAKNAGSFEVRELGGGVANIAFDYRIMAKRKGQESLRMKDVSDRTNQLAAGIAPNHNAPKTRERITIPRRPVASIQPH